MVILEDLLHLLVRKLFLHLKVTYFCMMTELRTKENFPFTWHKN